MRVIDPGHFYELTALDATASERCEYLLFVKRVGEGYPGNEGPHPGTTTQEVLRALIERMKYVNNQIYDRDNVSVLWNLRRAIWHLENRAAQRHGRSFPFMTAEELAQIEDLPVCAKCNHIGCEGGCHD